jgi:hypothetical protein
MQPWQKAQYWLAKHFPKDSFEGLLAHFLQNGFVWSSPLSFMLFKPVFWDGKEYFTQTDKWNAWFIHLAAGDLTDFEKRLPFRLDYVLFQRHGKNKIHAYEYQTLASKFHGIVHT